MEEKINDPCGYCEEIIKLRDEGNADNGMGVITLNQRMFLNEHTRNCPECAKLYEDVKKRKLAASQ